jgi:hypothetical protein
MITRYRLAALLIGVLAAGVAAGAVALATPASAALLSASEGARGAFVWLRDGGGDVGAAPAGLLQNGEGLGPCGSSTPPAPPDGADVAIGGEVSAVSGSTYTVGGPDGSSLAITATGGTTYVNADGSPADAAAVKPGVFITAEGTLSNQGKTLSAERITIGKPQGAMQVRKTAGGKAIGGERTGPSAGVLSAAVGGEVGAVSGSTYTVGGPDGSSVAITATSSTTYVNADGSPTDAAAVKPGVFITAEGTPSDDGSGPPKALTAQRVTIGTPQGALALTTSCERTK